MKNQDLIPYVPQKMLQDPYSGSQNFWTPYNMTYSPQVMNTVNQPGPAFGPMVAAPQSVYQAMPEMTMRDKIAEATGMWNRVMQPYTMMYPGEDYVPYTTMQMPQANQDISYVPQDELYGDLYPVRVPDVAVLQKLLSLAGTSSGEITPDKKRFKPVMGSKKQAKLKK